MPLISRSQRVIATALCGALYGATGYITSSIPSPLGPLGQFRPAIIVPVIFAVFFGPWVAGVGAAIGSQITDMLTSGYFLSGLIAGMPGNFAGFYLYGWLLRGKFSWRRYVLTSVFTLFFANLFTAALVDVYYVLFLPSLFKSLSWGIALAIGLGAYWFITMLPFALTIDPALIKVLCRTRPDLAPAEVLSAALKDETREVAMALIVTGALICAIGIVFLITPEVVLFADIPAHPLQLLFGGGGLIMIALGIGFLLANRLKRRSASGRPQPE